MPKSDCSGGSAVGSVKVRYLVARRRSKRPTSYYWIPTKKLQNAGFLPRRLPDVPAEAVARAEALNAELDRWYSGEAPAPSGPAAGSLRALDDLFQRDDSFLTLRPRTQRDYLYSIKPALAWAGDEQARHLTLRATKAWYRAERDARGVSNARNAAAALRRLLSFGKEEGWITDNPALKLRIASPASRSRIWSLAERDALVAAAIDAGRPSMALAVMLGWCLGQRPADLRTLAWSAYDGAAVQLRQEKTGTSVWLPALPELRALLDRTTRQSTQIVVSENTGRPYKESDFQHTFAQIRDGAGLPKDLQFRDLRRTLATALGAAGCTDDQIRSITGHKTREVVSIYVRPDTSFAQGAMKKLRAAGGKKRPVTSVAGHRPNG
jgi:integrase